MDKFEQRKRAVLQPIYFEAGAALSDCQSFEYGLSYLLYLFSRLGVKGLGTSNIVSILENEEKKTAGQLVGLLKKHVEVSEGIEESLSKAIKARNLLIHRYFMENVERMADVQQHEAIVKEISALRSKVRKSHKQLEPFVTALAESLDGIEVDELASVAKDKFITDTESH